MGNSSSIITEYNILFFGSQKDFNQLCKIDNDENKINNSVLNTKFINSNHLIFDLIFWRVDTIEELNLLENFEKFHFLIICSDFQPLPHFKDIKIRTYNNNNNNYKNIQEIKDLFN